MAKNNIPKQDKIKNKNRGDFYHPNPASVLVKKNWDLVVRDIFVEI